MHIAQRQEGLPDDSFAIELRVRRFHLHPRLATRKDSSCGVAVLRRAACENKYNIKRSITRKDASGIGGECSMPALHQPSLTITRLKAALLGDAITFQ